MRFFVQTPSQEWETRAVTDTLAEALIATTDAAKREPGRGFRILRSDGEVVRQG